MGKRRCQKKRGGGKSLTTSLQSLINKTNSHDSASFSSTSGPVTGCTGCVNGNSNISPGCNLSTQAAATQSAKNGIATLLAGIRGQVGGNGTNVTVTTMKDLKNAEKNNIGFGRVPTSSASNCGQKSSASLGARKNPTLALSNGQSGGGFAPTKCVNGCNNLGNTGYGYATENGQYNSLLMGSGYPIMSPYNVAQCTKSGGGRRRKTRCKGGRKRSRKGGRKSRKGGRKSQCKSRKGGRKSQCKSRKGGRRRKRLTQRGGYHQFGSNNPSTPGFASPKVSARPWATGPLSKSRQINCGDNYNHYTGKYKLSPILDAATSSKKK